MAAEEDRETDGETAPGLERCEAVCETDVLQTGRKGKPRKAGYAAGFRSNGKRTLLLPLRVLGLA